MARVELREISKEADSVTQSLSQMRRVVFLHKDVKCNVLIYAL